jgi:hypothetical protein
MDAPGSAWKPDADVIYRIDELGERIGVIPATCRNGEHSLNRVGYRAHETPDGNYLHISCNACAGRTPPRPDHYWALHLTGPKPRRAEMNDDPYQDLRDKLATR